MSAELNHARVRVANAILVELRVAQTAGAAVHSHTRGVDTAPSHPRDHGLLVAMKTRSGASVMCLTGCGGTDPAHAIRLKVVYGKTMRTRTPHVGT